MRFNLVTDDLIGVRVNLVRDDLIGFRVRVSAAQVSSRINVDTGAAYSLKRRGAT